MDAESLADEIHRAESCIERYARFYRAQEADCPADFKLLMLLNGWHNPFVALNELLKRIDADVMLLKRQGVKVKTDYRKLRFLVQECENGTFQKNMG